MRTFNSFVVIVMAAGLLLSANCAKKASGTETVQTSATVNPVTVLVRNRNTGMLAVDGILCQVHLLTTEKAAELKDRLRLHTDESLQIIDESSSEYRSPAGDKETPTPVAWENDPKNFDFFVSWTIDSVEQRKRNFNA